MTRNISAPNIEEPRVSHKRFAMTVVIPTYNREDSLPLLLARFAELSERMREVEIIVIDDGSTDGTKQFLAEVELTSEYAFRCFFQKNAGAANARNLGIK